MTGSMRRPRFGSWSAADVLFGLGAVFLGLLTLFMLVSAVFEVTERDGVWVFAALGRLVFAGFFARATRDLYRRVGAPPAAG